jgi:hypothetical protein
MKKSSLKDIHKGKREMERNYRHFDDEGEFDDYSDEGMLPVGGRNFDQMRGGMKYKLGSYRG